MPLKNDGTVHLIELLVHILPHEMLYVTRNCFLVLLMSPVEVAARQRQLVCMSAAIRSHIPSAASNGPTASAGPLNSAVSLCPLMDSCGLLWLSLCCGPPLVSPRSPLTVACTRPLAAASIVTWDMWQASVLTRGQWQATGHDSWPVAVKASDL